MSLETILATVSRNVGPPRLLELGRVKIGGLGEKRKTAAGKEWRLPRKDDFFTVTGFVRSKEGDLIPDKVLMDSLTVKYGDQDKKLRQLPICVLSDDIDRVLSARFAWYGRKICGAYSDGETVTWKFDPKTLEVLDPPRVEPWTADMLDMTDKSGNVMFKLHCNFSFSIRSEAGRFGGVYVFRTTSVITFRQLYASLLEISEKTGGVLTGMPLWFVVRPMLVAPDGKPTNVFVCHVECRGRDLQELQQLALEQAKFRLAFADNIQRIQRQYQKLLVAPGEESLEDAADIAAEFAPVEQDQDDVPEPPEDVLGGVAGLLDGDVGQRNGRGTPVPEPEKPALEAPSVAQDAQEPAPVETAAEPADDVEAANRAMDEAAAPAGRRGKGKV